MILDEPYLKWKNIAILNNYKILAIIKDLEDFDTYPIFFNTEYDFINYRKNIISESKVKILEIIYIN